MLIKDLISKEKINTAMEVARAIEARKKLVMDAYNEYNFGPQMEVAQQTLKELLDKHLTGGYSYNRTVKDDEYYYEIVGYTGNKNSYEVSERLGFNGLSKVYLEVKISQALTSIRRRSTVVIVAINAKNWYIEGNKYIQALGIWKGPKYIELPGYSGNDLFREKNIWKEIKEYKAK